MVKASKNNSSNISIKSIKEDTRLFLNKSPIVMSIRIYVFIIGIMLSGMFSRTFFGQVIAFIGINERKETYNPQAVKVNVRQVMVSGRIIALMTLISIMYVIISISGTNNFNILIPGLLISFGICQQMEGASLDVITEHMRNSMGSWTTILHIFAKRKRGIYWEEFIEETELLWAHPQIRPMSGSEESLEKIERKISEENLIKYMNKGRDEMNYYTKIEDESKSKRRFFDHALEWLHNTRDKHDDLNEVQQRLGTWSYAIYLGIGTIIWLIQPF